MDVQKEMPTFVFEERRYDEGENPETQPEGWVFVTLTPERKPFFGSEDPFDVLNTREAMQAYGTDPSRVQYESKLEGWMRTPMAEQIRLRLQNDGFTKVSWDEVPEKVFSYLLHRQAPIEWQSNPDKVKGRSWVWLKGEWPSPPVYGQCTYCGCIEVELDRQVGIQDLSEIGEAPEYPFGSKCEVCRDQPAGFRSATAPRNWKIGMTYEQTFLLYGVQ